MLTDERIEYGKKHDKYSNLEDRIHEHNDSIRMAYEWLDAQKKIKKLQNIHPLKHLIEEWAGRYVSEADVEVAAFLHPEIRGTYPRFNISTRLREPLISRLEGISEAFKHYYRDDFDPSDYSQHESNS